jgi:hypothetical protein
MCYSFAFLVLVLILIKQKCPLTIADAFHTTLPSGKTLLNDDFFLYQLFLGYIYIFKIPFIIAHFFPDNFH